MCETHHNSLFYSRNSLRGLRTELSWNRSREIAFSPKSSPACFKRQTNFYFRAWKRNHFMINTATLTFSLFFRIKLFCFNYVFAHFRSGMVVGLLAQLPHRLEEFLFKARVGSFHLEFTRFHHLVFSDHPNFLSKTCMLGWLVLQNCPWTLGVNGCSSLWPCDGLVTWPRVFSSSLLTTAGTGSDNHREQR